MVRKLFFPQNGSGWDGFHWRASTITRLTIYDDDGCRPTLTWTETYTYNIHIYVHTKSDFACLCSLEKFFLFFFFPIAIVNRSDSFNPHTRPPISSRYIEAASNIHLHFCTLFVVLHFSFLMLQSHANLKLSFAAALSSTSYTQSSSFLYTLYTVYVHICIMYMNARLYFSWWFFNVYIFRGDCCEEQSSADSDV